MIKNLSSLLQSYIGAIISFLCVSSDPDFPLRRAPQISYRGAFGAPVFPPKAPAAPQISYLGRLRRPKISYPGRRRRPKISYQTLDFPTNLLGSSANKKKLYPHVELLSYNGHFL